MDQLISFYHENRALLLVSFIGVATFLTTWLRRDTRLDTIPGPKGWPIIGFGWSLPPKAPTLFRQWASEYGELFKMRIGWYDCVVVNSPDAIREIFEKQAISTSSKAPSPLGHDVVTMGRRMPTMPYGPHWRAQRSVVRQILSVPMTLTLVPTQEFEVKQLLWDLATNNENQRDFYVHMRRFIFSQLMTNTFGIRINEWDHPDANFAARSQGLIRETSKPGAFYVDELPPLQLLPEWLQPGRSRAEKAAKELIDIKMRLWRRLEKQLEAGHAPACYGREILESKESWYAQGLTDEDLAWVASGLVEAGFETSAAGLNTLILQLAGNPRVQKKAQEELMRVVGKDRLPTFADMPNLPYIRACVKEALRINPILAPGIRHYTDNDVTYKGQVIPKGTVLYANTAFLHYDPARYDNPEEFRPERYLEHQLWSSDYAAMSDPYKRDHFTFSTGRRTCPGARLAEMALDIGIANIMWAFEVRPPVINGVEGKVDTSQNAYPEGGFTPPKPFAVRFVPWTDDRLRLVKETWKTAERDGYKLRGVQVDVNGMLPQ
jgi:cytochrome P450